MSDINKKIYERKKIMLGIFIITKLGFFLCFLGFKKTNNNIKNSFFAKKVFKESFANKKNPDIYYL